MNSGAQQSKPIRYPVIALRNIIIFPKMILPLFVGRQKSIEALEQAVHTQNQIVLTIQKNSDVSEPTLKDMALTGVLGEIVQLLKLPDGTTKVLVEGKQRVALQDLEFTGRYFQTGVELLTDQKPTRKVLEGYQQEIKNLFENYAHQTKKISLESLRTILETESAAKLFDLVASYLPVSIEDKQKIIEAIHLESRFQTLKQLILRESEVADVEDNIHQKVKAQIDKVQKEYYLKEKLKAIQKELGDEGELDEFSEYQQKIKTLELSEVVEVKALREVARLKKVPTMSSEAGVIRTYLDTLLDLPWKKSQDQSIQIERVKKVLDQEHYGLDQVKERILEFIAVYQLTQKTKGSILCLMGPPGVGKTSIAQSIANAMQRPFEFITLGGVRDQAELRGHRRTYVGAMPGRIIQAIQRAGSTNPVILLDEIDKIATDFQGDPSAALLEILDPKQNKSFTDHYLETPYDLSDVLFIATANTLHKIPKPLLDRMEVIPLSGYTEDEKVEIVKRHVWNQGLKEHGLEDKDLQFTEVGLRTIIREYTREAGLRDLIRCIHKVFRKAAKDKLQGQLQFQKFSKHNIHHFLGGPKYQLEAAARAPEPGLVTGLAWTEAGGKTLSIEASALPGRGSLTVTGQVGEVMQESAQAALSYVRSIAVSLGLSENFYRRLDIHVHVPEGAIPKDGPSAGISMATALVSILSNCPVRSDMAMTGEITLRGRVLPVGGVKEKILSAARAGMKYVVLPFENQKDIQELEPKIKRGLKFIYAKHMKDVLGRALIGFKQIKTPHIESSLMPSATEETWSDRPQDLTQ